MILSFSKKMIPNTGIRVCYTQDFHTITDFGANEEGLPLMILSDHFETAPPLTRFYRRRPVFTEKISHRLEVSAAVGRRIKNASMITVSSATIFLISITSLCDNYMVPIRAS